MPQYEKMNNSVKYSHNFMKNESSHLHHALKLYSSYQDPSSSGSPDIAIQYKMPKSEKGYNSANSYRVLLKLNQVIYTFDATCLSNNIILAKGVL